MAVAALRARRHDGSKRSFPMNRRMWRFAAIGLCFVGVDPVWAQSARPPRLVFDRAHGEQPPPPQLNAIGGKLGLDIYISTEPISRAVLDGARILYLRAPSGEFTAAETEAIVAFVKGGGSLLLVLDEERRQSLEKTRVNGLISPFGLRLTPDTRYLHNTGALAKAGEINEGDREVPFSGGRAVEGGTPFAFQLDKDGKPSQPFGAYTRVNGGGRIVVLGEGMASLFLGDANGVRLSGVPNDPALTRYWGKDSGIFMEEVLAWLAARSAAAAPQPSTKASQTFTLSGEMLRGHENVQRDLAAAAEKMPEEHYGFRPTPDIKPFGQLVAHAALAQFRTCAMLTDERSPWADEKEDTARTKVETIALLKASNEYCDPLVRGLTETTVTELANTGPNQVAKGLLPASLIAHGMEMYGTMAVYLRLKGIVPPSTERQNQRMK
jgi:hypothetical protein